MVDNCGCGLGLIKMCCYWPKGVPAEEIFRRQKNKEVGDVDTVQGSI